MQEMPLFAIGLLLGVLWFGLLIQPVFYGIPKATLYISRGFLKKGARLKFLRRFILGVLLFLGMAALVFFFLPGLAQILMKSSGFGVGQLTSIGLLGFMALTRRGRRDLDNEFWGAMIRRHYIDIRNPQIKTMFESTIGDLFMKEIKHKAKEKLFEFVSAMAKQGR